jgi:hypothetical protein
MVAMCCTLPQYCGLTTQLLFAQMMKYMVHTGAYRVLNSEVNLFFCAVRHFFIE